MKFSKPFSQIFLAACLSLSAFDLRARQDEVTVEVFTRPGSEKPVPISISGFTGEAAQVIEFDLFVQGFITASPETAQYLLSGSNNGNLVGRATDRINKSVFVNKSYTGAALRRQAHAFVDDFLKAINRKGIGQTKIAFKGPAPRAGAGRGAPAKREPR